MYLVKWHQCLDDPNKWASWKLMDSRSKESYRIKTTDELISDGEDYGELAIANGNFSMSGLLLIIKEEGILPLGDFREAKFYGGSK